MRRLKKCCWTCENCLIKKSEHVGKVYCWLKGIFVDFTDYCSKWTIEEDIVGDEVEPVDKFPVEWGRWIIKVDPNLHDELIISNPTLKGLNTTIRLWSGSIGWFKYYTKETGEVYTP